MLRSATFVMICAAALMSACGDDSTGSGGGGQGGGASGGGGPGGGGTGGSALAEGPGEFDINFETSADFFTAMSGPKPGTSPHGTQQTWYSRNLQPVIDADAFDAPVGTVSIKKFDMMGDGTQVGLAVMIKKEPGYDSANNDWYYDMRMLDGTLMEENGMPVAGPIGMCIDCHQGASATDYLAGTKVR